MYKENILNYIDDNFNQYTAMSDFIWDNPELRFDLKESADIITKKLEENGFKVERKVAGMNDAFVATYDNGGPVIGFLGEYDALYNLSQVEDVYEKKVLEEDGAGHGCGHNLLGIGSLASAIALKNIIEEKNIEGTIKYYGCPAEEGGSGKAFMARDGIFDEADSLITWHPMTENRIWGESSLANFQIYFKFKGISSHAASAPEKGRSALDACELMNSGVNYLREHVIQEARIHYAYIDAGGQSPNVVQPTASLLYYIRAPKSSQVNEIFKRIEKIAKGAALMTETEVEIIWDSACSEYIVNETLAEVMYENMKKLGEIEYTDKELEYADKFRKTLDEESKELSDNHIKNVFKDESEDKLLSNPMTQKLFPYKISDIPMMGSTDVGDASFCAPTVQLVSSCYPRGTYPHSWQWVAMGKSSIAHKGMMYAAKAMALTAYDLLMNEDLIEKAKEELNDKLNGGSYVCYIPEDVVPEN